MRCSAPGGVLASCIAGDPAAEKALGPTSSELTGIATQTLTVLGFAKEADRTGFVALAQAGGVHKARLLLIDRIDQAGAAVAAEPAGARPVEERAQILAALTAPQMVVAHASS